MNHFGRTNKTVRYIRSGVGLSTSCSRFSKNFFVFLKKGAQKLLFVTKVARNVTETFFDLMLKYANCTAKIRFLSIFLQFGGVTSVAE